MGILTIHSVFVSIPVPQVAAEFVECADGLDNDHDGEIDYPEDQGCTSLYDESENNGKGIFLSITDGLNTVRPGGLATYTITIHSERSEQQLVDMSLLLPHQTNIVDVRDGGSLNGEFINWKNVALDPGVVRTFHADVHVNPHADEGYVLVSEVIVEGEKANDTTRVIAGPEAGSLKPLKISIDDGRAYANRGEFLTYRIAVRNPGDTDRTYSLLTNLPPNLDFVEGTGHFNRDQRAISWKNEFIPAGAETEFFFTARVEKDTPDNLILYVRISAGASLASDATSIISGVPDAAFRVSVNDHQNTAMPGELITYNIHVENLDSILATDISVNAALPTFTEFVDAAEGGRWTGSSVRWEGLTVSPHGERNLQMTLRVRSDAPFGAVVRQSVSIAGTQGVDLTEISDRSDGTRTVQAGVLLQKFADRTEVRPGDTISYTITFENILPYPISNFRVEDRMDMQYMRVIGASSGQMEGDRIVWSVPQIAPGEKWTVNYTAQVSQNAPHGMSIGNIVTVSGQGLEGLSLTERTATLHIGIVSVLPPTGVGFDGIFLGFTGFLGAIQAFWHRRRMLLV
jgi:uncharacterized repeat protein (TIGR01451 family)